MTESETGWKTAIRIALGYPGVTIKSPLVKAYAQRYGVNDEMLDILEHEAAEEAQKFKRCLKCNGSGVIVRFLDYLALCDCINAKRHKTIGPILNNTL